MVAIEKTYSQGRSIVRRMSVALMIIAGFVMLFFVSSGSNSQSNLGETGVAHADAAPSCDSGCVSDGSDGCDSSGCGDGGCGP